ncbi:hemerythrin domain-containing protein [Streptomyces blastmyceticus]|uniref:Hemerythrin-like domain-containing protein n=1 Tax=Streptomyces blastmyceticus TaxID=68180 RepID=A0ABN0X4E1_9ACTN
MARTDILTELETDHRVIEALFNSIHRTRLEDVRREDLLEEVATALARHSAAEEEYLYPAVREQLAEGDTFVDKEHGGQERLTAMLRGLESSTVYEPGFDARVRALEREVGQHVRHEERDVFPMLRHACPLEMLRRLGEQVREGRHGSLRGPAGES